MKDVSQLDFDKFRKEMMQLLEKSLVTANFGTNNGPISPQNGPNNLYRPLPPDYKFPNTLVPTLWNLWWFGDQINRYRPFRFYEPRELAESQRGTYNRLSIVVDEIDRIAIMNNLIPGGKQIFQLDYDSNQNVFKKAYQILLARLYPSAKGRPAESAVSTIYDHIRNYGPRNRRPKGTPKQPRQKRKRVDPAQVTIATAIVRAQVVAPPVVRNSS